MKMVNYLKQILQNDNVFLSGGAGVGKSHLVSALKKDLRLSGKNVIALGSTAISAFNISGVTLHSFFALGICNTLDELLKLDKKQKEKLVKLQKILKNLDLLIIDEISMVSAELFELFAFRLRTSQFQGKVLVVGDFLQLPPVLKKEQISEKSLFSGAYYAFSSLSWADFAFKNVFLKSAKRTNDLLFYNHLSNLRQGRVNEELLTYFENLLISKQELSRIDDDYTLLCSTNKKAELINNEKLNKLEGELFEFKALAVKNDANLDELSFEKWRKSLNVSENLKLKVGAKIVFCINNYEAGYFNGEQGKVSAFVNEQGKDLIEIEKDNGELIYLDRYSFTLEDLSDDDRVLASVSQFPIKLAYAITIHKAQGMSIARLVCDIGWIFENAQLYVALSRASQPQSLKLVYEGKDFKAHFIKALKLDENALDFYKKADFIDLEKEVE